jgi:membrane-bound lytic murein transglycosylase F
VLCATTRIAGTIAIVLAVLAFDGCREVSVPLPGTPGAIEALVRPGPTTWFTGTEGAPAGLDHDLLRRYSEISGQPLSPQFSNEGYREMLARVSAGKSRLGAGGLYRPAPGASPAGSDGSPAPPVLWTRGYYTVRLVLVYAADGFRPRSLRDLGGARVAYGAGGAVDEALQPLRERYPAIRWEPRSVPSADALIGEVDTGQTEYAIVASHQAAVARSIYLNFDVAFSVGPKLELAWMVAPGQDALRERLDAFLDQASRDGTIEHFVDRYFNHPREVQRIDAGVFQERVRTLLPDFRRHFHEAQEESGLDWRLLAAVAYQESHWDPLATSGTGVRGIMQLTEDTARHLGVEDRLDARSSVLAAARYLRDLKGKVSARVPEPDRTWLSLAAYNIGFGHVEDARALARRQKLDPDRWTDLKKTLPLLAEPEFYAQARLGYARGGMPVAFVDRVRAYYDMLVRQEPPHQPRLRMQATREAPR